MIKYITKTTLRLVALLFFVSVVTFTLVEISPIDPIEAYISAADVVSAEQRLEIEAYFGLDKAPVERYISWISCILRGDFGISIIYRQPVIEVIVDKFPSSLALMITAFLLSGVMGLYFGILMGKSSKANKLIKPICLTLSSVPTFFIGIIFLIVFSVQLGWFPVGFSVPIGVLAENVTVWDRIYHMILPSFTLAIASFSGLALHTREKVMEVLQSDYVLLAKTRGMTENEIIRKHVLRNILLPFITLKFSSLSELFGGSILAETVFSYAGLGSVIVEAGTSGDVTLLLGVTIFSCIFVFTGNFIANVLYAVIDPKIRVGGSR